MRRLNIGETTCRLDSASEHGLLDEQIKRGIEGNRSQRYGAEYSSGAIPVVDPDGDQGLLTGLHQAGNVVALLLAEGILACGEVTAFARQLAVDVELVNVVHARERKEHVASLPGLRDVHPEPVPGLAIKGQIALRFPVVPDADVLPVLIGRVPGC